MTVLGCTGHQAIPLEAFPYVDDGVASVIQDAGHDKLVGVCSLAVGADQLFATYVLDVGGQLHVVVPCDGYEATFDAEGLRAYRSLLAQATDVEKLPYSEPSEEAFLAAGYRVAERCEQLLAVWDGKPAKGLGGTADVVARASDLGRTVHVVWPEGVSRS